MFSCYKSWNKNLVFLSGYFENIQIGNELFEFSINVDSSQFEVYLKFLTVKFKFCALVLERDFVARLNLSFYLVDLVRQA